jgi:nicotinamide-nucleotide amidase
MRAIILSIGDELALGQTVDTNSAWLAQQLAAIGYRPVAHLTVPDDRGAITQAFEESVGRCDAVIVSGGLGPTDDDLTRQALSDFLNEPLELMPAALENVERFFKALHRDMPEKNRIQAMLPRGTQMIENTAGTAPGIACDYISGDQKTVCKIFIMPGVPKEMKIMFDRSVRPKLAAGESGRVDPVSSIILSKTLHTFGLGESAIAERLGDLMRRDRNPSVGTTVANGYVSLRLNAYFPTRAQAEQQLADTESACRAALGDLVWGQQDDTLQEIVGRLLASSHKTVTTAESCTGGLLAKLITDIPGSSTYFKEGWVTYSNQAKQSLLNVSSDTLAKHGAVSQPVVEQMATNALERAHADAALAISGIAGPDGGTPDKPVGTVWLALATRGATQQGVPTITSRTFIFHGDREMVRDRSAKMALTLLRFHLLGKPLPF